MFALGEPQRPGSASRSRQALHLSRSPFWLAEARGHGFYCCCRCAGGYWVWLPSSKPRRALYKSRQPRQSGTRTKGNGFCPCCFQRSCWVRWVLLIPYRGPRVSRSLLLASVRAERSGVKACRVRAELGAPAFPFLPRSRSCPRRRTWLGPRRAQLPATTRWEQPC